MTDSSQAPYTTEQIVTIYDYLHRLGGPKGIIRQCEFFLYSKKDRMRFTSAWKGLQVSRGYFMDPRKQEGFRLVKEIGLKETGILVSCSDYHIFYKMKIRRQAMEHYLNVVRSALRPVLRLTLPPGRHYAFRHSWFCHPVLLRAYEAESRIQYTCQGKGM